MSTPLPPCLQRISDMKAAFERYNGRPPKVFKVGLRCMSLIADEVQRYYHLYPDLTLSEHRELFLRQTREGQVKLFGMSLRMENGL